MSKQTELNQRLLVALGMSTAGAKIVMEEITSLRENIDTLVKYKWAHDQMMIRVEEGTPIIFEGKIRYERVPNVQTEGPAA